MSQTELALAVGIAQTTYSKIESMSCKAYGPGFGGGSPRWTPTALLLAEFYAVPVEELFPAAVLAIDSPVASCEVNADEVAALTSTCRQRLLESPEQHLQRAEISTALQNAVATLTPNGEKVIRRRFGLDDREETLHEIALDLGLSDARVLQIEKRSLWRLRISHRLKNVCK
jgi:RNA polymerase sigma factor (sigma-70 family)